MPCKVVHPDQWDVQGCRQPFGAHKPRHDATNQSWPCCSCDGIQVMNGYPSFFQRGLNRQIQLLCMRARGELWNHSAKGFVQFGLAHNHG